MAARQPMGSGGTMLDELWPTLKAFPGQIASLPSWWGSDAPPALNPPPAAPAAAPASRPRASGVSLPPLNSPYGIGRNLGFVLENIGAAELGEGSQLNFDKPVGPSTLEQLQSKFSAGFRGAPEPPDVQAAPADDGGLPATAPFKPYNPLVANSPVPPPLMLRSAGMPQLYSPGVEAPAAPAAEKKAAPASESIRALRLPNGKVIFTNQASMYPGASEVSRADAGRDIRGKAAAQRMTAMLEADAGNEGGLAAAADPFAFKSYGRVPSSQDMAPLVQRSADLELQRMMGQAPAYDPEFIGGSPATDETTARVNDEMMIEKGGRELDKANLATALAFARLPIEQQQAQQNPQIAVAQWAMGQVADIDASIAEANAIGDPALRDRTIAELQAQKEALNQMFFGDFARPGLFNSGR